jgi:hypothetical protein
MPKDESTNSSSAAETPKRRDAVFGKPETSKGAAGSSNAKTATSPAPARTWSAAMIAGVSAAGLGLLVAAGISGAAIGQAVDHSHRDKAGSSEMRDHGKNGMQGPGMQGKGMQGPGMDEPGSVPVDPNEAPVPGDAPVTGQSPTDPSGNDRDRGDRQDRGDGPGRNG